MRWQLAPSSQQSISAAERALAQAQDGKTCTSPSLQRGRIRPLSGPQAQNRLGAAVQDGSRQQSLQHENLQDTQRRLRWVGNVPVHLSHWKVS